MSRMWMTVLALMLVMAGIVPGRAQSEETAGAAWDRRYSREMYLYGKEPVDFLRQVAGRLRVGTALLLAAGEGRNAVFLAQQGFAVTAIDISGKGPKKCRP